MKNTFEVLSIFFISILFLFTAINKKSDKIKENQETISNEFNQSFSKSVDYKATPIIIVKRD